jgi:hypothetical protein
MSIHWSWVGCQQEMAKRGVAGGPNAPPSGLELPVVPKARINTGPRIVDS